MSEENTKTQEDTKKEETISKETVKIEKPEEKVENESSNDAATESKEIPEETAQADNKIVEEKVEEKTEAKEIKEETNNEPAYKAKLVNFKDQDIKPGQTVKVHELIVDISPKGDKRERVQIFEGIILGLKGSKIARTITVRKISGGIAVEKIYPINSPIVTKIELVKTARVRKAKLNYLRNEKRRFKRKLKETYVETHKKQNKKKK